MKYFLLGAFASALFLFGVALIYGYSGSLRFSEISTATGTPTGLDSLLVVGLLFLLAGLLFKIGAVPFHLWTPDVYQGAPTPITAFMAACTKVAAFGALLRVVYAVFPALHWDINPLLWIVTIATMVVGTVAALVQNDVKRLLAYSSIAHAGFVLTGVVALHQRGIAAVLIYLLAYGAATVGAFGIVYLVRERSADGSVVGEATALSQWAGLGRAHPLLAATFTLFLLSFAGIPLTAGFIGKFAVFSAAVAGGAWPLALVGVLASAAAAFFYVRVIVLMFFTERYDDLAAAEPAGSVGGAGLAGDAELVGDGELVGGIEPAGGAGVLAESADGGLPAEAEGVGAGGAVAVAQRSTIEGATTERIGTNPRTTTTVVVRAEGFAAVAIVVCAIVTVVVGVFPTPVLNLIDSVARFLP